MRRALARLAPLLLLVLLVPAAAGAVAPAPTLQEGDFWERVRGDTLLRETVEGFETVEVGGEAHAAVRLVERASPWNHVEPPAPSAAPTARTTWLRVSDLAFLRLHADADGSSPDALRHEAHAPCAYTRWPLEVGAEWTVACTLSIVEEGATRLSNVTLHRRVAESGNTTVMAGTFHVHLVETRAGNASGPLVAREWHARAACGAVRSETYEDGATIVTQLHQYRCLAGHTERPSTPTPPTQPCGRFAGLRCTPGPGAADALLAVGLVGLARLARRAKRS